MALDDRYAIKFAPLDSTAFYPKSGHTLLYTTFNRWNEMSYKSYLCLVHFISTPPMLMPHKHQLSSSLLIINTNQHLAWSSLNDMIHFISSCALIGSLISTSLALHRCLCPLTLSLCSSFSATCGASFQSLRIAPHTCNWSIVVKPCLDLLYLATWLHVMYHMQ